MFSGYLKSSIVILLRGSPSSNLSFVYTMLRFLFIGWSTSLYIHGFRNYVNNCRISNTMKRLRRRISVRQRTVNFSRLRWGHWGRGSERVKWLHDRVVRFLLRLWWRSSDCMRLEVSLFIVQKVNTGSVDIKIKFRPHYHQLVKKERQVWPASRKVPENVVGGPVRSPKTLHQTKRHKYEGGKAGKTHSEAKPEAVLNWFTYLYQAKLAVWMNEKK